MITIPPEEARKRFGEIMHAGTKTFREFDDPEGGIWRPVFVEKELVGYRLYKLTKLTKRLMARWKRR